MRKLTIREIREIEQEAITFYDRMRFYEIKSANTSRKKWFKKTVHLTIDNRNRLKTYAERKDSTIFAVANAIIEKWFENEK